MLSYENDQHLKYVLDLRYFVFNKLPEDGILMPKHVGVGTLHEVCFMTCLLHINWYILLVKV